MRPLASDLSRRLRRAAQWMRNVRSYDPGLRQTRLGGPASVQIQTIDRCNASCVMCPYSSSGKTAAANSMDDGLYRRILDEIREAGGVRSIMLMLQNEPLLDRKFADRVRVARQLLGRGVRIGTVTNGAPLTAAAIEELAASGIDHVSVSIDAVREQTYARIRPGLDFRRIVANTVSLIGRLGPRRVSVKFLRQRDNEGEENAFASYWRRQGVRVVFSQLTNRAGSLESYERIKNRRPEAWKRLVHPVMSRLIPACPLPFTSMNVLWDGRVITCCNDWGPRDTVGDLSRQTLRQVWKGDKINRYRHLLWTGQTAESPVCADCSLSRFWKV